MEILDIFYKHIVKEASVGRIDCYMYYNIIFSTRTSDGFYTKTATENNELFVPTLNIKDIERFNKLLIEYVTLASSFYDDSNFFDEVLSGEMYNDKKICKEKVIMTLLWSNATVEDFNDPITYLQKRINFLTDERLNNLKDNINLGYSEILNGNIIVNIEKDVISNETPYKLTIKCVNPETLDYYRFPSVKLGLSENEAYIYAIQNEHVIDLDTTYSNKVKRTLFKIGEGFDSRTDNFEIYDIGNLKDVTPSFVVAACITMSLLDNLNIDNVVIPSILIERWNAKKLSLEHIPSSIKNKDQFKIEKNETIDRIQTNITDKLIRTFNRLDHHFENINTTSIPYELDSKLHLNIQHSNVVCNNILLQEIYELGSNYNINSKHY